MTETLQYVFEPRLFFPDKPDIKSDSEMVRKYSGVWVAGEDQSTDIAFGYAAESYIDFGIPMMFVPMFIWSAVHRTLPSRASFACSGTATSPCRSSTVIGWLSLYLFERSWAKTIGLDRDAADLCRRAELSSRPALVREIPERLRQGSVRGV